MQRHPKGPILIRGDAADEVNPNFVYLTGLRQRRGALLLCASGLRIATGRAHPGPDYVRGREVRQILFLPPSDPLAKSWGEEGCATLDAIDAQQAGVELFSPQDLRRRVAAGRPAVLYGADIGAAKGFVVAPEPDAPRVPATLAFPYPGPS